MLHCIAQKAKINFEHAAESQKNLLEAVWERDLGIK